MYNFSIFKTKLGEVDEWLSREYTNVRTGKATPQILDSVMVDSYGSKMPVKHISAISIEDAKTLRISPWDKSQIGIIQKAIEVANIGLSVSPDSDGLRLSFPDLTEERRKMLMKIVNEKLEDGRISVKKEREKIWTDIQDKEKTGEISEDEKFKAKDELQKIIDEANKKLEDMADRKEKEIMN
ncbi:MAG: ribosome recycling factor [Candidatus Vogelbacteria bacterium]|nr:ribosome recycling factor [Candidatus Vogelbacteria bacterium]